LTRFPIASDKSFVEWRANPAVVAQCLPMDDPTRLQAEQVPRPTCRRCGAPIDPRASAVGGLCSACFGRRAPNRAPRAKAALAELAARGPVFETPIDGEVLKAGKTLISLGALVPVVGPYLIHRSVAHTAAEKRRLSWLSIAMTTVAATWLIVQLPRPAKFDPRVRTRLESEMNALGSLANQYRVEHGDFPDVATWRRLADSGDPSFYDPWRNSYRYERTVDGVTIRTLGQDGIDGGMGIDADLSAHFSSAER
jgi:Type II secretion system (T2SS), protein G